MIETYFMGAYWGARLEFRSACADRLLQMLTEFQSCHERLVHWCPTTGPASAPDREVPLTYDALLSSLKAYELADPTAIGYLFDAGHGDDEDNDRTLSVSCGGLIPVPGISNCAVLGLPEPFGDVAAEYPADVMLRLLQAMIQAWEPDYAMATSRLFRDRHVQPDFDNRIPGKPAVGWMTYLRAKRLRELPANPPCEVIDVPDRGSIFIVTREHLFSVDNPEDVAGAQTLIEFLEEHGALIPIPPNLPF